MARTGFVINSGIKQIFTTGPSTGNSVVNGYAINGVLQGPTVNHNQSFIEGSVETISAGSQIWRRKFEDQSICAAECNSPVLSTSIIKNCDTNVFTLTNTNVNATASPNTRIEVSIDNFSTILTTFNRSNTNGNNVYNIDLNSLGIIKGTNISFRLTNLCPTVNSQPSNIASTICEFIPPPPPPPPPPTTVRLTWSVGLYGGYNDGGFGISVNGISTITSNVTDNSYIDVPLNSEIFAYVNAPSMFIEGNSVPYFNAHVYAVGPDGGVIARDYQPTNPTAQISFIITGETSIYADASAFTEGQPVIN